MRKDGGCFRSDYTTAPVPSSRSLNVLASASKTCEACPWVCDGQRAVFGEGPKSAEIMLVGEQPGDIEDQLGRPFVGPSGLLLDDVLEEIELNRKEVYLTNAVKHFKYEPRGKRRLHKTPNSRDMNTCKAWLLAELEIVRPSVLICLGAVASKSLLGNQFRITKERGKIFTSDRAKLTMATWHPSALLRAPDESTRKAMRRQLTADISNAVRKIQA